MGEDANALRILLIAPHKNDELRAGQYLSPPIGIHRIASYLNKRLHAEVAVYDCDLDGVGGLQCLVEHTRFDIIGFSLLQPTLKNDIPLMNSLRKIAPDALFVAGGQGAVFNIDLILKKTPIEIIIKGLGEFALEEIAINLPRKGTMRERFGKIDGISIRSEDRIIHTTPRKPYTIEEFREASMDFEFSKVPYERYWSVMQRVYTDEHLAMMKNENQLRTIRIMTSSHCPKGCSFCSSTNFFKSCAGFQKPLLLPPSDILTLMKNALAAHPGTSAIYFCDDDFTSDPKRVSELCDLIAIDPELEGLTYFCLSRIDNVDRGLLDKMRKTGFTFIIYGAESFSNRTLKDIEKKVASADPAGLAKRTVQDTIDAGITPLINIILFYPTAEEEDILQTIDTCVELVESGARITVYSYVEAYPGSKILETDGLLMSSETVMSGKERIELPKLIYPQSDRTRWLAEESLILRDVIIERILRRHEWQGVTPHPLQGLALFLAVQRLAGANTRKTETAIERIMINTIKAYATAAAIRIEGEC